jgi:hypothetical protein
MLAALTGIAVGLALEAWAGQRRLESIADE